MSQFCNYCGAPLNGTETICTRCGSPVQNTAEQGTTVLNNDFKKNIGGEETTVLGTNGDSSNPFSNNSYQYNANNDARNFNQSAQHSANVYQNPEQNYNSSSSFNQNPVYGNYGNTYVNPNANVIEAPQHSFVESYRLFWENYVNFNGRSRRSDYWNVFLWNIIINGVLGLLSLIPVVGVAFSGLAGLFAIASFLPMIALSVRRLQDTGKSGLLFLLNLIPIVGQIVLVVFYCQDSDPGNNRYGENPKYITNNVA